MAKAVLVCSRSPFDLPDEALFLRVADQLTPEGITPRSPVILSDRCVRLILINPPPELRVSGVSACLGLMLRPSRDWWKPGSAVPDGTFALFRCDPDKVELVSDILASRTIWYAMDENMLIASTSQRAIISFLGEFRLNRSAVAWFLSSGTPGPETCWDERICRIAPDSRVVLDRSRWTLKVDSEPVLFAPENRLSEEWERLLSAILRQEVTSYDWNEGTWWLTLSGGYDSRCLLMLLHGSLKPHCVTWGLRSSKDVPGNDAYIASRLARHYGLPHDYLETDIAPLPVSVLARRFLLEGEGCTDALFAYLDGFSVWREIYSRGCTGTIRGDEAVGSQRLLSENRTRIYSGMVLLSDYYGPKDLARFELPEQEIPEGMRQYPGESLLTYAQRMYALFCYPLILASLNTIKAGYVETANPLLSRSIVGMIRRMPDDLIANASLYVKVVSKMSPQIPFAKLPADDAMNAYLKERNFVDHIRATLEGGTAAELLPPHILEEMSRQVKEDSRKHAGLRMHVALKRLLPTWVVQQSRKVRNMVPDRSLLALRAMLVCELVDIFNEDAGLLERNGRSLLETPPKACLSL